MELPKFKTKEEAMEFIEENSINVSSEPLLCDYCGKQLIDQFGWTELTYVPDIPEYNFCDEKCLCEYLMNEE